MFFIMSDPRSSLLGTCHWRITCWFRSISWVLGWKDARPCLASVKHLNKNYYQFSVFQKERKWSFQSWCDSNIIITIKPSKDTPSLKLQYTILEKHTSKNLQEDSCKTNTSTHSKDCWPYPHNIQLRYANMVQINKCVTSIELKAKSMWSLECMHERNLTKFNILSLVRILNKLGIQRNYLNIIIIINKSAVNLELTREKLKVLSLNSNNKRYSFHHYHLI